ASQPCGCSPPAGLGPCWANAALTLISHSPQLLGPILGLFLEPALRSIVGSILGLILGPIRVRLLGPILGSMLSSVSGPRSRWAISPRIGARATVPHAGL